MSIEQNSTIFVSNLKAPVVAREEPLPSIFDGGAEKLRCHFLSSLKAWEVDCLLFSRTGTVMKVEDVPRHRLAPR